jgi:hypothetical protein
VIVCILAIWRGGRDERQAAGALFIGWLLTVLISDLEGDKTAWRVFAIDLSLFALLIWIALRSRYYWPLFAAGFHLLAVVTHLARAADSGVGGWAYITAAIIWGYLLAFTIGFGAWRYRHNQLAANADPTAAPGDTLR